jgi:hypothetical protein
MTGTCRLTNSAASAGNRSRNMANQIGKAGSPHDAAPSEGRGVLSRTAIETKMAGINLTYVKGLS